MNTFISIIILLTLIGTIITVLFFARAVKIKDEIENKYQLIHEEITSGSVHGINYTTPFVRHSIYDGLIVIAWLNSKLYIETSSIKNAELIKGIISEGIRYKTNNIPASNDITIWIRSRSSIISALEKTGINVLPT